MIKDYFLFSSLCGVEKLGKGAYERKKKILWGRKN